MQRLRRLGLIRGAEPLPPSLLESCHEGRLIGGMSLSVKATPDEVVGPLTFAMGGSATQLKVLDCRGVTLDIRCGASTQSWQVDDVEALIEQLNDFFEDDANAQVLVVLGEWEDMLQVWALSPSLVEVLVTTQLLDSAWNIGALREQFEGV